MKKDADYRLPPSLIGHADLARLLREIETVDGDLQAQRVRGSAIHLPVISQGLSDFLEQNELDISDGKVLTKLTENLRKLKDHAPVVHMTFAADVDPYSLQKLITWLRQEVHPGVLVTIGVQPGLIGGVYLRTPNHVHDFSIKALLKGKHQLILDALEELRAR